MKNLLLITSLFLAFNSCIYATNLPKRTDNLSTKQMEAQKETITSMYAKEISKTLPKQIDKYTKLLTVTADSSTIIYTLEINSGAKSDKAIQNEDKSRMQRAVTKGVCQTSKRFLDSNINISYLYISAKSKVKLFRFDITKDKCLKLNR